MTQFDDQGWWWPVFPRDNVVPSLGEAAEAPDQHQSGRLEVDDTGRATLAAYGLPVKQLSGPVPQPSAIWGVTVGGKPVSILEPLLRQSQGLLGGAATETWSSRLVVVGAHIIDASQLTAARWTAQLHGMREWLTNPWFGPEAFPLTPMRPVERPKPSARRAIWPPLRSNLRRRSADRSREIRRRLRLQSVEAHDHFKADGGSLSIGLQKTERILPFESHSEEDAVVTLRPGRAASLPDVEDRWLTPLADMLAVFTRTASTVTSLTAHVPFDVHPAIAHGVADLEAFAQHEVRVFRARHEPGPVPNTNGGMPLPATAAALGTRRQLVERWLRLHRRLDRSGTFLFGTLQGRDQWLENQLLNLVSFAEAYHALFYDRPVFDEALNKIQMRAALNRLPDEMRQPWRDKLTWATRMTQRQRLQELVDRSGWLLPEVDAKLLVRRLTQTRNYLTHWGELRAHVVEGPALAQAVEQLLAVLILDLFERLDIDPRSAEHAILRGDVFRGALSGNPW